MNERLQELAEQAEKWICTTNFEGMPEDNMTYDELYNKKFVELIVAECMEQVWYTREDGINGNVSLVIKERIKQHFGVEL